MNFREIFIKENETLISTQGQQPHNFSAKAQVGQGIEWPKAATVAQPGNVEREEVEMPGDHHVGHGDSHSDGGVSESIVNEDGEGGASAGATSSADIAQVVYPMTGGKTLKQKRKNARAAVGQAYTPGPKGVGTGVFEGAIKNAEEALKKHAQRKIDYEKRFGEMSAPDLFQHEQVRKHLLDKKRRAQRAYTKRMDSVDEAHTLDNDSVIYRLDRERPMSDTEVLVLGGAGRYTLDGLRQKARREAQALAKDLEIEHGGAFRRSAENVKQLTNTLNTIVAAYNELKRIRSRGGRGSRGITDEDTNFIRECLTIADQWSTKFNAQGK